MAETTAAPAAENERKVLVAVDETEESLYALSWCLKNVISRDSRDCLVLLYAKPPRAVSTEQVICFLPISWRQWRNTVTMLRSVSLRRRRGCAEKKKKVKVETRVEHGDARDVICQLAEKLNVYLLVMGSHGYGPIKRAFLGSVSNYCAQHVKRPVLIVKKPKSSGGGSK